MKIRNKNWTMSFFFTSIQNWYFSIFFCSTCKPWKNIIYCISGCWKEEKKHTHSHTRFRINGWPSEVRVRVLASTLLTWISIHLSYAFPFFTHIYPNRHFSCVCVPGFVCLCAMSWKVVKDFFDLQFSLLYGAEWFICWPSNL